MTAFDSCASRLSFCSDCGSALCGSFDGVIKPVPVVPVGSAKPVPVVPVGSAKPVPVVPVGSAKCQINHK